MKQLLLAMSCSLLLSIQIVEAKEVTGKYVSVTGGNGINQMVFKINGKKVWFEGIGFSTALFESHKNEPMIIRYSPEYKTVDNVYFADGTNANNEKEANMQYIRYKGKQDGMKYYIFKLNGKEVVLDGYALKIKLKKKKTYHVRYIERSDGSKGIATISLGAKKSVQRIPIK